MEEVEERAKVDAVVHVGDRAEREDGEAEWEPGRRDVELDGDGSVGVKAEAGERDGVDPGEGGVGCDTS